MATSNFKKMTFLIIYFRIFARYNYQLIPLFWSIVPCSVLPSDLNSYSLAFATSLHFQRDYRLSFSKPKENHISAISVIEVVIVVGVGFGISFESIIESVSYRLFNLFVGSFHLDFRIEVKGILV